jgi:ribosomal-protein-alanine N-acetyltransferase
MTRRLVLRPLAERDYEEWRIAHAEVRRKRNKHDSSTRAPERLTRRAFRKLLRHLAAGRKADKQYHFAVFHKSSGRYLGHVGLMDVSREIFQNAYIGWHILNTEWGQGYGTEACRAGLQIGFRQLKLHRIEAGIAPDNARSIALARSLGMRYEGLSKRRLFSRNAWRDMRIYALTSEDARIKWRSSQPN